jgi:hypothetical protein
MKTEQQRNKVLKILGKQISPDGGASRGQYLGD